MASSQLIISHIAAPQHSRQQLCKPVLLLLSQPAGIRQHQPARLNQPAQRKR